MEDDLVVIDRNGFEILNNPTTWGKNQSFVPNKYISITLSELNYTGIWQGYLKINLYIYLHDIEIVHH